MQRKGRSYDLLWLGLALMIILVISFLLPLQPQDFWWYLRIARDTVTNGALPRTDTLTFTRAGQPVDYQSWLSAIILFFAFQLKGLTTTFLLRGLVLGLTYGLLWVMMRERGAGPRISSLIVILAALSTSNNWLVRPQIFAYPLFVLTLWILWRWQQGDNRLLIGLPLLSLLWVNLHGSFILQFLLMGSALVFGRGDRRRLGILVLVCFVTNLLNPYGLGSWGYVRNMLSNPSNRFSNEWGPPLNQGWQMNIFFFWLLCFAPLVAFSKRRLDMLEWIWFLGFGWLALSGLRYVIWFMFILAVCTADLLVEWDRKFMDRPAFVGSPVFNGLLAGIFILWPIFVLPGLRESWWNLAPSPYGQSTPIQAAAWLKSHPDLPGQLWSNFGFSSYLEYVLPSRPVWIDTRFEVYPAAQWRTYLQVASAASGWESVLDRYDIRILMLSPAGEPKLIQAAEKSSEWCSAYGDPDAVIFIRPATASCP